MGDYERAKLIAADIQLLLRPTGHETRLMQAKNWLFEAAMEAGQLEIAIAGFSGIRNKVNSQTRTHLEATALLAICFLRRQQVQDAEPLIADVLRKDGNIVSEKRRRQFRLRAIQRFNEEAALAGLSGSSPSPPIDPDAVMAEAGELLRTKSEDQIMAAVGSQVPPEVIKILLRLHEFASRQLGPAEQRLLPPARNLTEKASLGRTITEAAKRVVWRALCDPHSDVYKLWCTNGMMGMLNTKTLTIALVSAFAGLKIGRLILASALAAMVLKMGLEVFCEVAKPQSMMIALQDG